MAMAENKVNETATLPKFRQRYRKSELIFEQGNTGSEMYLIHSGRVLLSVRETGGMPTAARTTLSASAIAVPNVSSSVELSAKTTS
jgi:hypothetical protein